MKKLIFTLTNLLIIILAFGQVPEKMSYQAVIRNSSNQLVTNSQVGIQISILQGSVSGTAVYVETHITTTNENGLATIIIGNGDIVSGIFADIDWEYGTFFLKTETDVDGGANYTITGTSQLLSVPYAMHAKTAENITGTITETDPVFTLSAAHSISDGDISTWNSKLSSEVDGDVTNELQTLSVSNLGDTLSISNGNSIIVPGISKANDIYSGLQVMICKVTIDTLTYKNCIHFKKLPPQSANFIRVYKEVAANEYSLVGNVSYSQDSLIDYTSRPEVYSEKYYVVSVKNGWESVFSPYHKTSAISVSSGIPESTITIQIDPYINEADANFVSKYQIYRGTAPGNMSLYDSIPNFVKLYNDINVFEMYFYQLFPVFNETCD